MLDTRLGFSRPSLWLVGSSVLDLTIASTLATCGIAMPRLPLFAVGGTQSGFKKGQRCRPTTCCVLPRCCRTAKRRAKA
ncbi:hypothetical protein SBA6_870022 [Candidatus Sulfopaludibacter sp. SbA6]|nr:hypothetical protein SBA6_870022 [Candidatus Sulfopaludibacter sp. SbA6]